MGAGKGDDYRRVDKKKFDKNFEDIFGKFVPKEIDKKKKETLPENNADVA